MGGFFNLPFFIGHSCCAGYALQPKAHRPCDLRAPTMQTREARPMQRATGLGEHTFAVTGRSSASLPMPRRELRAASPYSRLMHEQVNQCSFWPSTTWQLKRKSRMPYINARSATTGQLRGTPKGRMERIKYGVASAVVILTS